MKKYVLILSLLFAPLLAKVEVAATYPFIAELTKKVGGDNVEVVTLAGGNWDPHFVVPRPSLIRKLSRTDLLIINGAQLEIGWLPALMRRANNANIRQGTPGFLDLSRYVTLINKPVAITRANGDVHPNGNPHYSTDPYMMPILADAIADRLGVIDPAHARNFSDNAKAFKAQWQTNLDRWKKEMAPMAGTKVIQYHMLYNYFLKRFDLVSIGNIEPLPGINPSSRHTMELIGRMRAEKVKIILQDVYHNPKTAEFIAEKTGARVIMMPHDVGADHEADSLTHLYDTMVQRLLKP